MAERSGVEVLQNEIEKAKDKLKGYNENIKKLTGRDPSRPGIRRLLSGEGTEREDNDYSGRSARGRARIFGQARHSIMEDNGPPAKRRVIGGAFSRLGPVPARRQEREDSPYEEELPNKLSVHSSVVATSREAKNRKEILQEQTQDKEGMQRNRRMFGLLLGTLNKFKTESKTLETKEVQRKKIEEKLEENAEKEKRKFKLETKLLIEEMHLEQSKISRLQQKMEMVQEHADCEAEVTKLKNFIATKTKPRIFWKPQQMSATLENKLKESKKFVDGMLQESRDRLEKEIKELMEREIKREERIKMRLREDGLFEDGEGKEEAGGEVGGDRNKETERTVVEVKEEIDEVNTVVSRLGRHFEGKDMGDDNEDTGDLRRKKPKRTVVLERMESSESESEDEEIIIEGQEKEAVISHDESKDRTGLDIEQEASNRGVPSSEDEMEVDKEDGKKDRSFSDRPRENKELEHRGENKELEHRRELSEDGSSDNEVQRHRDGKSNEDSEKSRNRKDRSQSDSRKDRKKEEREDYVERGKDSRRRDGDKRSSKHDSSDKGKSRKERHETKRDKERRRDSHDGGKKSSSRHKKHRKRHSDSDESDIEIKQEKEVNLHKNKDSQSDSISREENTEGDRIQKKSKSFTADVEIDDV